GACKVGPAELAQVLRHVPVATDPRILVDASTRDDAAVIRLTADRAIVATVDFFTPIVDDPYAYGRIAAANAFSDLYAMAATPLFALNIVGWPRGKMPFELLGEVLRGGADAAREAGAFIVGGHSVDDPEPKYGIEASGVAAEITAAAVPLIPRAREMAERGAIPGGTERNLASVAEGVTFGSGIGEAVRVLLADAQTSGGLLIAVPPDRAPDLVAA